MRKFHFLLALILGIGIACFLVPIWFPDSILNPNKGLLSWGLIASIFVFLTILAFFFEFEEMAMSSKEIALVSMLGTISAVLRIPFAGIPGVQPCTFLIICSGYAFGPVAGFTVGAMTPFISNFFLGQGPWTPYQMFAWGLAGVSAAYLKRINPNKKLLVAFGILWGYLFGVIINVWFWSSFIYPLTFTTFIVTQINSLWVDTFHATGNAIFLGLFGTKTITILERFKKRFNWVY